MEVWELAARESIRDLVARYNASGDSGRFDETVALFTEDAVVEVVPGRTYRGREEIRSLFTSAQKAGASKPSAAEPAVRRFVRHYTATLQIDVPDPDTARSRCYYAVFTEAGLDHQGRYVDDYRCENERWLLAKRHITLGARVPGVWANRASASQRPSSAQAQEERS